MDEEIPSGVYLQGSHTCLVLRVVRGRVWYIPMDSLHIEKRAVSDFLIDWNRQLVGYPLCDAARLYLASWRAPQCMTESARKELKTLTCDDLLALPHLVPYDDLLDIEAKETEDLDFLSIEDDLLALPNDLDFLE